MIVLDDASILHQASQAGLLAALTDAFRSPASTPTRMHCDLPGDDRAKLLVMPCWAQRDALGVKVVTVMPSNKEHGRPTVDGLFLLLDGRTGKPAAVLSAPALTALRTASVCALATSLLARADATTLLMIGTGALAPHLIRAYFAVRPLQRVLIWGRTRRRADELALKCADMPVLIEVVDELNVALSQADLICSATLSSDPLVAGQRVSSGAHVDLVGSFTPAMREADTSLFQRGRLVVDSATAFDESGDLIVPVREGAIQHAAPDLTSLLNDTRLGRVSQDEITIFKTVGTGLADLAVARYLVESHLRL